MENKCKFCNEETKTFLNLGWIDGKQDWYEICNYCYKKGRHLFEYDNYRKSKEIKN